MKHHIGETNEMSETPSVCPFCGSYVATLDDGKPCGDSEGNWVAFRCLTSWHGGYHDPRKLQSKTCETVERHKLYDRIKRLEEWKEISLERIQALVDLTARQAANIKRLEEAGDAMLWYFYPKNTGDISFLQSEAIKQWNKAKEDKL